MSLLSDECKDKDNILGEDDDWDTPDAYWELLNTRIESYKENPSL